MYMEVTSIACPIVSWQVSANSELIEQVDRESANWASYRTGSHYIWSNIRDRNGSKSEKFVITDRVDDMEQKHCD